MLAHPSEGPSSLSTGLGAKYKCPVTDAHVALKDWYVRYGGDRTLVGMLRSRAIIWMRYCCFIPSHVAGAGFNWALPWWPCIASYRPWQKNEERTAVWGKHTPGPGDPQHDPGRKARASLGRRLPGWRGPALSAALDK